MTSIQTIAEFASQCCDLIPMHISRTHDEQFLLKKRPRALQIRWESTTMWESLHSIYLYYVWLKSIERQKRLRAQVYKVLSVIYSQQF